MDPVVMLFPGQASQYVGMAADLHDRFAEVRELFAEAEDVLGLPLSRLCFHGPEEELRQTAVTQPAVFVHSVAVWRLLTALGVEPDCVAGHSLGEYSALVASGAVSYRTGLELVGRRGRYMQEAGEQRPGTMAAIIGLDDDVVIGLCRQAAPAGRVVAANFNAPGQVVVSGEVGGIDRLIQLAGEAGARRAVRLPVSGAFHSPLMEPAADRLAAILGEAEIRRPRVPLIANVTARPIGDPGELRRSLVEQITHPVRWTESVLAVAGRGTRSLLEVGPGSVLKGLVRRIAGDLQVTCVGTVEEVDAVTASLGGAG